MNVCLKSLEETKKSKLLYLQSMDRKIKQLKCDLANAQEERDKINNEIMGIDHYTRIIQQNPRINDETDLRDSEGN